MSALAWSWSCMPYVVCAIGMAAVMLVGAVVRGDRVMRVGMIGAPATALPWAICSALAACTQDPELATRLLRLGNGPVAFVGPNLLLVLLGASGQLERYRWVARTSGLVGIALLAICWGTSWTVPGVRLVPGGIYYITAGPTTGIHLLQLGLWLAVGMVVARRAAATGERKNTTRTLIAIIALGAFGATDLLLVYDVWGYFPVAWLPTIVASVLALYLVVYTDLLRPRGLDPSTIIELVGFGVALAAIAGLVVVTGIVSPLLEAVVGAGVWIIITAIAWSIARRRVTPVRDHRALDELVADLADLDDEAVVAERLAGVWKDSIGIVSMRMWIADGDAFVHAGERWQIDPELAAWLVDEAQPIAVPDLATMRLGPLRATIEAFAAAHRAGLIVPLVDRGTLVGIVEADYDRALREDDRGLVAESSRVAARAVTYAALARSAARERETAREVEVAEAMRGVAAASRDDELGRWAVASEYRSAARSNGASWSASLLGDGRLAILVTEAQAHGIAAALATAAVTGAFVAATSSTPDGAPITLDDVLTSLRTSAEGVVRAGEPVAAFVAILDARGRSLEWASGGHPGGHVMTAIPFETASTATPFRPAPIPLEAARGRVELAHDQMLVVASSGLRRPSSGDVTWENTIRVLAAAGARLPALAVESISKSRPLDEDWLAIVVRHRGIRPSEPTIG